MCDTATPDRAWNFEKLSDALEYCLTSGLYSNFGYMCHALDTVLSHRHLYHIRDQHMGEVEELVESINFCSTSLVGAISNSGMPFYEDGILKPSEMAYQLYIWWIFDLRRKGL